MPKQNSSLNLTGHLSTPVSGASSNSSASVNSGASASDPTDYRISALFRYAHLSPAETEAAIRAEELRFSQLAHLALEINAPRLKELSKTSIFMWKAACDIYYKMGGRQSLISLIDPLAIHGFNNYLEQRYKKEMDFDDLSDKEKRDVVSAVLDDQADSLAKFEAELQQISLSATTFNIDAHTLLLAKFRAVTKNNKKIWESMPKDSQLRALIGCFAPASFQNAARLKLKTTVHATYYDGLSILFEEATLENIRTERNAAARVHAKSAAAMLQNSTDDKADDVEKRINLATTERTPCANCITANRPRGASHSHQLAFCDRRCAHTNCSDKAPHLCAYNGKLLCKEWFDLPTAKQAMQLMIDDASDEEDDAEEEAHSGRHFANMIRSIRVYPSDDDDSDHDSDCPEGVPN